MITQVYGFEDEASLTVYLQEEKLEFAHVEKRPFVLVIPGGGYSFCSERESEPIALNFFAQGYHAGVLCYHVGNNRSFEKSLEDGEKALLKIKNLGPEWRIDHNKIAVLGFSAGGHLAAALSNLSQVKPNLCILGYPAILESFSQVMNIEAPSLEKCVTKDTPPTFIFSTFEDNIVPIENSLLYLRALEEHEVPFETHIFQKGPHGLALTTKYFGAREEMIDIRFSRWFPEVMEWMEINWKKDEEPVKLESLSDYSIRELIQEEKNLEILLEFFPHWRDKSILRIVKNHSLTQLFHLSADTLTKGQYEELIERLEQTSD